MTEAQARYQEYLQSDYWKQVERAVKARADWRCQVCNSPHDLQAHHRTYANRGNELDHLSDLTCLCLRCHQTFHGKQPASVPVVRYANPEPKQRKQVHIPDRNLFALTRELISGCKTKRGGFTNKTLQAFGLKWPLKKGWKHRLIGLEVTREQYQAALDGAVR